MSAAATRSTTSSAQHAPAVATALDELLPRPDVRTAQGRAVRAPVEAVSAAIRHTPLADARLAHLLLLVGTAGEVWGETALTLGELSARPRPGLAVLAATPNELVFGWTGRPWPGGSPGVDQAEGSEAFATPPPLDAVRVATSIRCDAAAYGTLLATETRVAIGADASRPFRRYWSVARFGAGLAHASMLRAIARHATAQA